jgi:TrpR family trp operon transcriptional repressor
MNKYKDGWNGFVNLCLATQDTKLLSELLDLLLTPEEKTSLAMRYLITQDLVRAKKTQRQIAKDLAVSIAKITRGSNALKRIDRKLQQFLRDSLGK